jgi:hypothetical protein
MEPISSPCLTGLNALLWLCSSSMCMGMDLMSPEYFGAFGSPSLKRSELRPRCTPCFTSFFSHAAGSASGSPAQLYSVVRFVNQQGNDQSRVRRQPTPSDSCRTVSSISISNITDATRSSIIGS